MSANFAPLINNIGNEGRCFCTDDRFNPVCLGGSGGVTFIKYVWFMPLPCVYAHAHT